VRCVGGIDLDVLADPSQGLSDFAQVLSESGRVRCVGHGFRRRSACFWSNNLEVDQKCGDRKLVGLSNPSDARVPFDSASVPLKFRESMGAATMRAGRRPRRSLWVPVLLLSGLVLSVSPALGSHATTPLPPLSHDSVSTVPTGAFAFVSTFEGGRPDHWRAVDGGFHVGAHPNYAGEPALVSSASPGAQLDVATYQVVPGQSFLSLQGVLNVGPRGTGFIGLGEHDRPVALLGIGSGQIWAGTDPDHLGDLGPIPSGSAQPLGWTYLTANLYEVTSAHAKTKTWKMDVFVDQTALPTAVGFRVPSAGNYTEALLLTTRGTVAYTDLILTTYQIAEALNNQFAPNPSDGYGQGSGILVRLLPAFTTLSATIDLANWTAPQKGILSVQINAMNPHGAETASCRGFFQLGVDLDPGGRIAPWYVPGVNCNPNYFRADRMGRTGPEFPSPPGTVLFVQIQQLPQAGSIRFTLVDHNASAVDALWTATIPYAGPEFVAAYTQIEWQATSKLPVSRYFFNGSFSQLRISGGNLSAPQRLGPDYMVPFAVGVPPSWNFYYYNGSSSGYSQVG
jgi:hypothetical protein